MSLVFNWALSPLELLGNATSLILASGVFGVIALLCFKQISWQRGIRLTKDKIKGHMIAIRIYQDDLGIVIGSVGKVLLWNFQYLGLNIVPIVPLFAPFLLVASQLVVRYAFAPLPLLSERDVASVPGTAVMVEVRMKEGREAEVSQLALELPPILKALSPLACNAKDGVAVLEFGAVQSGTADIVLRVDGKDVGTKSVSAGTASSRLMQPERVSGFWESWLWPAEPTFSTDSPVDSVRFVYPDRDLGFLPGGAVGVLLTFFVASIVFGVVLLKPLNIQI